MNLEMLRKRKKERGLTNQELAELSGVPLGTVNKIFSGATKSPQYDTLLAIETALGMNVYQDGPPLDGYVKEAESTYGWRNSYTIEDYHALPDNVRAELIDGQFYYMGAPSAVHQLLLGELYYHVKDYIKKKKGPCNVFLAPFDVRLDQDDKTVVQPDLLIICTPDRLNEKGLDGAPEFVAEIVSSGTAKKDYSVKLRKYWNAGVKEYWVIDPVKSRIVVYTFEGENMDMKIYGMTDRIPVGIYEDLTIDFGEFDMGGFRFG